MYILSVFNGEFIFCFNITKLATKWIIRMVSIQRASGKGSKQSVRVRLQPNMRGRGVKNHVIQTLIYNVLEKKYLTKIVSSMAWFLIKVYF